MEKYYFKLPIGDWSNDGHGKCEWYTIESNYPVQDVRDRYFKIVGELGHGLDSRTRGICSEYTDSKISKEDILELGLNPDKYEDLFDDSDGLDDSYIGIDEFVDLFLDFMMTHAPELQLKIVADLLESFTFYGFDRQGRHIGHIGYGLFD